MTRGKCPQYLAIVLKDLDLPILDSGYGHFHQPPSTFTDSSVFAGLSIPRLAPPRVWVALQLYIHHLTGWSRLLWDAVITMRGRCVCYP
jgi:hypothetical protein